MLRLIVLGGLLAVSSAQSYYYCDYNGTNPIKDSDFFLHTRNAGQSHYSEGLICEFNAVAASKAIFVVEFHYFLVQTAVCTISSGGKVLNNGSSIAIYKYKLITSSNTLQLRFDATGDFSSGIGVVVRVLVVNFNECPPDWTYYHGSCHGASSAGDTLRILNYTYAQKACNSMRSNLLVVPSNFTSSIDSFVGMLSPRSISRSYTWIGMTDRANQNDPYWLNGVRSTLRTSDLKCTTHVDYKNCDSRERCGSFNKLDAYYAVHMRNCSSLSAFICSMPIGGTDVFYAVPDEVALVEPPASKLWLWLLIGGLLVLGIGLLVVGILYRVRASRAVAGAGAGASHGSGSTPPAVQYPVEDPVHYPVQHPVQHPVVPSCPPPQEPPMYSTDSKQLPPPPSYSDVMGNYQNSAEWQQQAREK